MDEGFSAAETRHELILRLSEAVTDDGELAALVAFLRDDLAYAPTNRTIVGAVLREEEFEAWKNLMLEVERPPEASARFSTKRVRDLAGKLMAQIRAA